MRVAIDARLNAYRRGGIPEYTRQLLAAMAAQDRQTTFIALQHRDQQRPLAVSTNVQRRTILTPPHHRLEQWSLPTELLLVQPDLLHCPDFIVPLRRTFPAVTTIHDLAFIHYPDILDDDARNYYNQVRASVHSADAVIAVSEATRADIVNLLDLPAERIDVVYEAASPFFTPLNLDPDETNAIGGHTLRVDSFMLFVSTLEPRKNLPTLLQALRICIDRQPEAGYRLAIAGARGWRYKPILETVRDLRLEDAVLFLDSVSGEELRWLYNACRLYVNPSLYEGFGLPVLEAMACGAPTLVSNTSSLPELVGDAALLLPPLEPEAWADAIQHLWHDSQQRDILAAAGPAQARTFSGQRAAQQTLAIYRRVLSEDESAADYVNRTPAATEEPVAQPEPVAVQTLTQETELATIQEPEQVSLDELLQPTPQPVASQALRRCLRCNSPLDAGVLSGNLHWHAADDRMAGDQPVRAWACPACGHVELALDRQMES